MTKESISEFRHGIRTHLNHISAYGELLEDDIKDIQRDELLPDIHRINEEAKELQKLMKHHLYGEKEDNPDIEEFNQRMTGPVYTVIGLAAGLIKVCSQTGAEFFVPDLEKLIQAGQQLVMQFQKDFGSAYSGSALHPFQSQREDVSDLQLAVESEVKVEITGKILVVDDNDLNRDILERHLERQGHVVKAVSSGQEALDFLKEESTDLVLLDIMMPGINGYQVLGQIKANNSTRHIPVIMISALDDMESVIRCIKMGAEDYLPKSFDPVLLKARIGACLEKKQLRDQETMYLSALIESQKVLEDELAEAAGYVKSLLPAPGEGSPSTNWVFIPSTQLGGDCFGYHSLDEDHFVFYLLDVSGHGIGAALLSVSVMNVLRTQSLPKTNFHNPSAVLEGLNRTFQMEKQNNMYFTIWYGVYNRNTKELHYACAGAPPALLFRFSGDQKESFELSTDDMIVGIDSSFQYESKSFKIEDRDSLYLFSDGVYEVRQSNGKMLAFNDFINIIKTEVLPDKSCIDPIFGAIKKMADSDVFEDDFSLLEVWFS